MSNEQRVDCAAPSDGDEAHVCACEGAETSDRTGEAETMERPPVVLSSDRFVHRPPPWRRDTAVVVSFQSKRRKL